MQGTMTTPPATAPEGPWNPGLQSQIPADLLPLATIYRPEYTSTSLHQARELADLTGLPMEDLVVFLPERLVMHELLAQVTAGLSVDDGQKTEDLGINFRRITGIILTRHLAPHMAEFAAAYAVLRVRLSEAVTAALESGLQDNAAAAPRSGSGFWSRLFGTAATAAAAPAAHQRDARDLRAIHRWETQVQTTPDPLQRAAAQALIRVVSAMHARHGRLWGDNALIAAVATDLACNEYGSEDIGRLIEPYVLRAAQAEGLHLLPVQAQPVVMNTKGASAAGKSTLRPLQRALAERIGVRWEEFALISPDIFRKFLLDYATLGSAYKYAGAFTGHELQVVDHKLDRTMARKAARGAMSHLLIDRFRFDTFAPASDVAGSNLLTRFGNLVYLFFVLAPPHATVERAWGRGREVGRYKAVDDLLAHNIEAFNGIPEVFFTWALSTDKKVHYEFLDNSVALGQQPRTAAFGWNGELNVLDVKCLLDIDRYRKINVDAHDAQSVYASAQDMAPERNTQFLAQCVRRLPAVNFADWNSGRIYLRTEHGKQVWSDPQALAAALTDPETRAGLQAVAPLALAGEPLSGPTPPATRTLTDLERVHTLGNWGNARIAD